MIHFLISPSLDIKVHLRLLLEVLPGTKLNNALHPEIKVIKFEVHISSMVMLFRGY